MTTTTNNCNKIIFTHPNSGNEISSEALLTDPHGQGSKTTRIHSIQREGESFSFAESEGSLETVGTSSTPCTGTEVHHSPDMSGRDIVHFSALELEQKCTDHDDDPVDPVCHGRINLSSRQLSDIFALFEGAQLQWPKASLGSFDSADDAKTTVTGNLGVGTDARNPLVVSLERECEALKEISHTDTVTILQLKDEVEALRTRSAIGMTDAIRLKEDLDIVIKERDLLKEREAQHLESLKILKQEIDSLTKSEAQPFRERHLELERLRAENELFATQIIENEVEMREIRTVVQYLDEENSLMRKDLDAWRAKVGLGIRLKGKDDLEQNETSHSHETQVKAFAAQILAMQRVWEDNRDSVQHEIKAIEADIKAIKDELIHINQKPEYVVVRHESMLETNEGIEVTFDGLIERLSKDLESGSNRPRRWSGLCDCFPRSLSADE